MFPLAQIETVLQAADKATAGGDRWLFVALLGIGICFCAMLFRYFTERNDNLQLRIDKVQDEVTKMLTNTTVALTKNTEVMDNVLAFMKHNNHQM